MKSQWESPDAKMMRCLSEENKRLKIDNLAQGQKLYIAQADIKRLNLELTQLNEELTATDTAWQNAELREAALEKRLDDAPVVTVSDWMFPVIEGKIFNLNPGESCKVRIVREVE